MLPAVSHTLVNRFKAKAVLSFSSFSGDNDDFNQSQVSRGSAARTRRADPHQTSLYLSITFTSPINKLHRRRQVASSASLKTKTWPVGRKLSDLTALVDVLRIWSCRPMWSAFEKGRWRRWQGHRSHKLLSFNEDNINGVTFHWVFHQANPGFWRGVRSKWKVLSFLLGVSRYVWKKLRCAVMEK